MLELFLILVCLLVLVPDVLFGLAVGVLSLAGTACRIMLRALYVTGVATDSAASHPRHR